MKVFLIILTLGTNPTAEIVDDYNNAKDCFEVSFALPVDVNQFTTCVGTEESSEEQTAKSLLTIHGYNLK